MPRNKFVSVQKIKRGTTSPSPSFHHSRSQFATKSISRKNSLKTSPKIIDWTQILNQIVNVTDKVKKLCKTGNQNIGEKTNRFIRSKPQNKSIIKSHDYQQINSLLIPLSHQQSELSAFTGDEKQICSYKCHQLMYECMKLNKQNKKLKLQKQSLQKRLYFESKQKKQLRWKIEKQSKEKSKYCTNQSNYNSFTLALSSHNLDIPQYPENRYASPLNELKQIRNQQKLSNQKNLSSLKENNNKSDSLLIDFEIQNQTYGDKENSKADPVEEILTQKTVKSISLQKDFNQLLEICKLETDGKKKKIIRRQMKILAEQLKSLRLE